MKFENSSTGSKYSSTLLWKYKRGYNFQPPPPTQFNQICPPKKIMTLQSTNLIILLNSWKNFDLFTFLKIKNPFTGSKNSSESTTSSPLSPHNSTKYARLKSHDCFWGYSSIKTDKHWKKNCCKRALWELTESPERALRGLSESSQRALRRLSESPLRALRGLSEGPLRVLWHLLDDLSFCCLHI